jgi:hypothetical protein
MTHSFYSTRCRRYPLHPKDYPGDPMVNKENQSTRLKEQISRETMERLGHVALGEIFLKYCDTQTSQNTNTAGRCKHTSTSSNSDESKDAGKVVRGSQTFRLSVLFEVITCPRASTPGVA